MVIRFSIFPITRVFAKINYERLVFSVAGGEFFKGKDVGCCIKKNAVCMCVCVCVYVSLAAVARQHVWLQSVVHPRPLFCYFYSLPTYFHSNSIPICTALLASPPTNWLCLHLIFVEVLSP